jgi:hypothetical protein
MRMTIFWNAVSFNLAEIGRRFTCVYCLHYEGDEWSIVVLNVCDNSLVSFCKHVTWTFSVVCIMCASLRNVEDIVRFEVFTKINMMLILFWGLAPWSSLVLCLMPSVFQNKFMCIFHISMPDTCLASLMLLVYHDLVGTNCEFLICIFLQSPVTFQFWH